MTDDARGPRERAYDEHIAPLMTRIIEIANAHKIPFVASFELDLQEGDAADDPMLCTSIQSGDGWRFRAGVLIAAAKTIAPAHVRALAITTTTDSDGKEHVSIRGIS